ncbi:LPP20 family lipoprotein [bacterium]|nr:LPP20 family lipoprotein [bacterium]
MYTKSSYLLGFVYLFVFMFTACSSNSQNDGPWTFPKVSHNSAYYIGVGRAEFYKDAGTTLQRAKQNAMADLAQNIYVEISSVMVDSIQVKDDNVRESYSRYIEATVKNAQLVDIEKPIIDTHPRTGDVQVILRINKMKYEEYFQTKSEEAKEKALVLWRSAKNNYNNGIYGESIRDYISSYMSLLGVKIRDRRYEYPPFSGNFIDLQSDVSSSLFEIFESLNIEMEMEEDELVAGLWNEQIVNIGVLHKGKLLKSFPLIAEIDKDFMPVATDISGHAKVLLNSKNFKPGSIRFIITPDLNTLIRGKEENNSFNISSFFTIPRKEIIIPIRPLRFCLKAEERSPNRRLRAEDHFVSQNLKNKFIEALGCEFVKYERQADLILKLNVQARQTQVNMIEGDYLYVFRANVTVNIEKSESREQILSWIQEPPSKSAGRSLDVGWQNALRAAGKEMKENYADEIIQRFLGEIGHEYE